MWHVSIAIRSPITRQPKLVASWAPEDRKRAEDQAHSVLAGAGVYGREVIEMLTSSLHLRRETTGAERDAFFKSPSGRRVARQHEAGEG